MRKSVLVLASMALAVLLICGVAWADTFTVTNTNDAGPGSLRAAISRANAHAGKDVISFAPGVRGTIELRSALPELSGELDIRGPGAGKLTVHRAVEQDLFIFDVAYEASVSISGLTVSNGSRGGIINHGELTLKGVYVSNNYDDDCGGGMESDGKVTVINSTLSDNFADGCGGGIANFGPLTVVGSTFFDNTATAGGARGGGGAIHSDTPLRVENSTFVRNTAGSEPHSGGLGGAIQVHQGELTVVGSTFFDNRATADGGGVHRGYGATVISQMSIYSGNHASRNGPDIGGSFSNDFTSRGYNLISDTTGTTGFRATDITNVDAGFDPRGFRNYGGPTRTMALTAESPAVDAVARDSCPLTEDQRGVGRPKDGDGNGVARCDIGAFERAEPSSQ